MIYDQARVLKEVRVFFTEVYIQKKIQNQEVPQMDKRFAESLDKEITEKENVVVLKKYL